MLESVKKAAKTMEAVSMIAAEIILHTNEVFAGLMKYLVSHPQKSGGVTDATTNLGALWSSLGIIYSTSSNVEYDRKSILMVGLLPEKKQDKAYLSKKAKNIENEFFKFQSALKVIILALRYFAGYQTSEKYNSTIHILSVTDKKIDNVISGAIREDVETFIRQMSKNGASEGGFGHLDKNGASEGGACVSCVENSDENTETITFGGNQYVVKDNIKVRTESRKSSLEQLTRLKTPNLIHQYIVNFYCVDNTKKFIELARDSTDKKLKSISRSAKLCLDSLFGVDFLNTMFSYIVRHTQRLKVPAQLNLGLEVDETDGVITTRLEFNGQTRKFTGTLESLQGMFKLLREIDIGILSGNPETLREIQVSDDSDRKRSKVFKRISELFNGLTDEYSKKYFIYGGDDSPEAIIAFILEMDKFETENSEKILELETKFSEKAQLADELLTLLNQIISPDKSTCLRKLIQYVLAGEKPESLL
jgi:hypothetical protein